MSKLKKTIFSILIDAPLEKVFSAALTYPLFVNFYCEKKILEKSADEATVKMTNRFFCGLKFSWEGHGRFTKDQKIEWTQTKGLLKGLRATWLFIPMNGQTNVSIEACYNPQLFFLSRPIAYLANLIFIKKSVPKILSCLKNICEQGKVNDATV